MILELLALATLLRVDPAGDAHGAGDLVPPSAALYADRSPFDLLEVEVGGDDVLTVRITVAGIPDPGGLPNGMTLPVIDVYLDLADGGEHLTLPGVGMALSDGRGWEVALRVHGDDAYARLATDPDGASRPVSVARRGDDLIVTTSLPAPDAVRDVQAVTGVYDPFSRDGWRPLSVLPSPWAFASEVPAPPVIDLLASSDAAQRSAIRAYVLPPSEDSSSPVGWLLLMFAGLGLAAAGLWLRRRVPTARPAARDDVSIDEAGPTADEPAEPKDAETKPAGPSFWLEDDEIDEATDALGGPDPYGRTPASNWTAADWDGAPASTRRSHVVLDEGDLTGGDADEDDHEGDPEGDPENAHEDAVREPDADDAPAAGDEVKDDDERRS